VSGLTARLPALRADPLSMVVPLAVIGAAGIVGIAFAVNVQLGVAALLGLICFSVAIQNLQLSLVVWFPLVFLEGLPAFNLAAKAGGLLIVGVWFVWMTRNREHVADVLRRDSGLWTALALLLLWCTLSLFWAEDRGMVLADLWHWYAVALLMLIVATTVSDTRVLRWIVFAFVAGAFLTVSQGIAAGGLSTSASAIETATEGRLEGGQKDPNFLAAGIAPAMILALAAFTALRGRPGRWWLIAILGILALGLAASESRGGALAALAAAVAALFVFKNRRLETMAVLAVAIGVAAAWFSVSPSAWERVTDFDSGGSGRDELWQVAWRMAEDNPVHGVALNNYPTMAAEYVDQPGGLARLDLIVDRAQVVHNAYLQLLAETGLIGLGLFFAVAFGSMRAAWRSADRFRLRGDESSETLARGVVVAMVALMAASTFISNGVDKRLWVLFGLGPALMAMSSRPAREPLAGFDGLDDELAPLGGDPPDDPLPRPGSAMGPGEGSDGSVEPGSRLPAEAPVASGLPALAPPGAAARLPAMADDVTTVPGPAVQHFLEFAANEMRRLQDEAELVRTRLQMSVPAAPEDDSIHAVSELADSLMTRSAEMAQECARLSAIADRVAATMGREGGPPPGPDPGR
jgi:O-antigen ligase